MAGLLELLKMLYDGNENDTNYNDGFDRYYP